MEKDQKSLIPWVSWSYEERNDIQLFLFHVALNYVFQNNLIFRVILCLRIEGKQSDEEQHQFQFRKSLSRDILTVVAGSFSMCF